MSMDTNSFSILPAGTRSHAVSSFFLIFKINFQVRSVFDRAWLSVLLWTPQQNSATITTLRRSWESEFCSDVVLGAATWPLELPKTFERIRAVVNRPVAPSAGRDLLRRCASPSLHSDARYVFHSCFDSQQWVHLQQSLWKWVYYVRHRLHLLLFGRKSAKYVFSTASWQRSSKFKNRSEFRMSIECFIRWGQKRQ